MKKFLIGFVLCMFSFVGMGWDGNDSTLYWMVNDSATVDGKSMHYDFLVPYVEDYDNWNAIRVKVVSPDGSIQRIIDNLGKDKYGNTILLDGKEGMPFDDSSGYWGVGSPSGIQSPLSDIDSLIAAEYYIQAELGRLSWNYDTDLSDWTTLAYSKYEQLTQAFKNNHMYDLGDMAPPGHTPWTPTDFYTMNPPIVPEPSTGLLFLVGMSLLMLKRRLLI